MNRSWPMIKVCGIRNKRDAETVLEKGANSIGLLIGLTHKAEDHVDEQTGKEIADLVRMKYPDARIVLVTHLLDPVEVKRIAENVGHHDSSAWRYASGRYSDFEGAGAVG